MLWKLCDMKETIEFFITLSQFGKCLNIVYKIINYLQTKFYYCHSFHLLCKVSKENKWQIPLGMGQCAWEERGAPITNVATFSEQPNEIKKIVVLRRWDHTWGSPKSTNGIDLKIVHVSTQDETKWNHLREIIVPLLLL